MTIGGSSCRSASVAQQAAAPGLINCTALGPIITECQRIGKPILLSMGGSTGQSNFSSAEQAKEFASTIWALFGADTKNTTTNPIRPFGTNVVLDGFDIDSEVGTTEHYGNFTTALRAIYARNTTKPFYISSAPPCTLPSKNLPLDALLQLDWVWPQFYDARSCGFNSTGFQASILAWSRRLYDNGVIGPLFYVGATATNRSSSGFVPGASLQSFLGQLDTNNLTNFGGMMLWDGSVALAKDSVGVDYLTYAKNVVLSIFNSVKTISHASQERLANEA